MNTIAYNHLLQANLEGKFQTVLFALVEHCFDKNYCYPSIKRLMVLTGLSRATVFRALSGLELGGFITRVNRFKDHKQRSNLYIINGLQYEDASKETRTPPSQIDTHKKILEKNQSYDRSDTEQRDRFALKNDENDSLDLPIEVQNPKNNTKPKNEVSNSFKKDTPRVVSSSKTPKKQAFKLDGDLNLPKILEIFELYTSRGFLKKSVADLIELLACCSWLNSQEEKDKKRPIHKKKIRNKYGLLTYLTKTKQLAKPIKWHDDEKARKTIVELRNKGLIDF